MPVKDDAQPEQVIFVNGEETTISRYITSLKSVTSDSLRDTFEPLLHLSRLNRREAFAITEWLLHVAINSDEQGVAARDALQEFLTTHILCDEILFCSFQIIRYASRDVRFASCANALIRSISSTWSAKAYTDIKDRHSFLCARHLSCRAFETDAFREIANQKLRQLLENRVESLKQERKELAQSLLALIRGVKDADLLTTELKRLASFIFTTGSVEEAPTQVSEATQLPQSEYTSSAEAECRRMFGLSTTLHLLQARELIGRQIRPEELRSLLRFGPSTHKSEPSNESWPTLREYRTMVRVLSQALEELRDPEFEVLALLRILITRITTYESEIEGNASGDSAEKEVRGAAILAYAEAVTSRRVEAAHINLVAASLAGQLLSTGFSRYSCDGLKEDSSSENDTKSSEQDARELDRLIATLTTPESTKHASRLSADELRTLRRAGHLSLEEFRMVTASLKNRAITCDWARSAFLEITRSIHDPSVTAEIRTSTLGGLVAEARKIGKLNQALEKEVFAVSAEIPSLPFLGAKAAKE